MVDITYGPTVSRAGMKHANNPWSNVNSSVKASSRSLSRSRGRVVNIPLTADEREQLQIETEFAAVKRKGDCRLLGDGSLLWTVPKTTQVRKLAEYDRWRPEVIKKVPKWAGKRIRTAAKGNADTHGPALQAKDNG